jgi:hypothetical protein
LGQGSEYGDFGELLRRISDNCLRGADFCQFAADLSTKKFA